MSIEDTTSCLQRQGEINSGFLRLDVVIGKGCLVKSDDNATTNSILIDLTIINPYGNSLFDRTARLSSYATGEAPMRRTANIGNGPHYCTTFFNRQSQHAAR